MSAATNLSPLQPGQTVREYCIEQGLSHAGSMGTVYKAFHTRLRETRALKQLHRNAHATDLHTAFEAEARILYGLAHPGLPRVYDLFEHEIAGQAEYFLVMDFVPGDDLAQQLEQRSGPFEVATVMAWARQLLDILEYLHTRPVIHRDIKPENIKVPDGQVKLLDFGLASGTLRYGSRHYAAPEQQLEGQTVGPPADLYGLAATLYSLLTHELPTDAGERQRALAAGESDPLVPVQQHTPGVPEQVSRVVEQALSLDPAQRPQSAGALRAALRSAPRRIAVPTEPFPVEEPESPTEQAPPLPSPKPSVSGSGAAPWGRDPAVWLVRALVVVVILGVVWVAWGIWNPDISGVPAEPAVGVTAVPTPVGPTPTSPATLQPFVDEPLGMNTIDQITQLAEWTAPADVQAIAIDPDAQTIVFGVADGSLRAWHIAEGAPFILHEDIGAVSELAFAPDGSVLGSLMETGEVLLWNTDTWEVMRTLDQADVATIAFHSHDAYLALGVGSQVQLYHMDEAQQDAVSAPIETSLGEPVTHIAFTPDGSRIAVVGDNQTLRLWPLNPLIDNEPVNFQGGRRLEDLVSISETRLATTTDDGTVLLWEDRGTYQERVGDDECQAEVTSLTVHTDTELMLLAGATSRAAICFVDLSGEQPQEQLVALPGLGEQQESVNTQVQFEPKGRWLVSIRQARHMHIWGIRKTP
jgi:WD40 repeat protein/tRNA A-37 threonylcarbamoyl transferase component Bud32